MKKEMIQKDYNYLLLIAERISIDITNLRNDNKLLNQKRNQLNSIVNRLKVVREQLKECS